MEKTELIIWEKAKRSVNRITIRMPKFLTIVVIISILLFAIYLFIINVLSGTGEAIDGAGKVKSAMTESKTEETASCLEDNGKNNSNKEFSNECDLKNSNNWLGIENFKIEQENIFKPILSENFLEGRELFCNKEVGINFQVYFKFTPLNNKKVNTSINYGNLWRIIIGNGDYRQIRVQKNEEYPLKNNKQVDWVDIKDGKKWLRLNSRLSELESLRQVEVEIISKISKENAIQENITLKIAGISKNEEILKDFDEYSFKISLPKDCNDLKEKIGVGILGTEKDEIKVQFEEFKIEELKF